MKHSQLLSSFKPRKLATRSLNCLFAGLGLATGSLWSQSLSLATSDAAGQVPSDGQYVLDLSADGRFTLFANNLLLINASNYTVPNAYDGPMLWLRDNTNGTVRAAGVIEQPNNTRDLFVESSLLWGSISNDARYVAFSERDSAIYLRDMITAETIKITETIDGEPLDGIVREPVISGDGRYVAFLTNATNLVDEPLPETSATAGNLLLFDRLSRQLSVAATAPDGSPLDIGVVSPALGQFEFSGNGQYLVYATTAQNAHSEVPQNGFSYIFRRNLATGEIDLVTRDPAGNPVTGNFVNPQINFDGSRVAFYGAFLSSALVEGRTPAFTIQEIFLKDLNTGETWHMDPTTDGGAPNSLPTTNGLDLNGAGDAVVFATLSSNYEAGHTGLLSSVYRGDLQSDGSVVVSPLSNSVDGFDDADAILPIFAKNADLIAYNTKDWDSVLGISGYNLTDNQGILVGEVPALDPAQSAVMKVAPYAYTDLNGTEAFMNLRMAWKISPDGTKMAGGGSYTTGLGRFYYDANAGYTFFGEAVDGFNYFEDVSDDFQSGFFVDRLNGISHWTASGGVSAIDLGGLLDNAEIGFDYAYSRDASTISFVVDPTLAADGDDRVFVWSVGEGLVEIDLSGNGFLPGIAITGISDDGNTVLGHGYRNPDEVYQSAAFLWKRGEGITVIPPMGGTTMLSLGLSADASVALLNGTVDESSQPDLILRKADGSLTSLGFEGYFNTASTHFSPSGTMVFTETFLEGSTKRVVVSADGRWAKLTDVLAAYRLPLDSMSQITAVNATDTTTSFGFMVTPASNTLAATITLPFTELPAITVEGPAFFGAGTINAGAGWIYSPLIGWIYRYGSSGWVWSYTQNSFLYFDFAGATLEADSGVWFYVRDLNGADVSGGQAGSPASWVYYHHSLWSVKSGFHAAYLYVATPPVGSESWHLFEEDSSGAYLTPVGGSKVKLR
jgi:hypothetical protein